MTESTPATVRSILAADIGGTNARFAAARVDHSGRVSLGRVFEISTKQVGITSFSDFWASFQERAPADLATTENFDAVSLAVAGPVTGQNAELTNIDWNIHAEETRSFKNLFLLNDFLAQGYALTCAGALEQMETIRQGEESDTGVIALVGAGTGLGHCALHPVGREAAGNEVFRVAGSEAGHATFAFSGAKERKLEQAWLQRLGKDCLSNDDVVSGPGLVNLHVCLTGATVTAVEALVDPNSATSQLFSRFYGRACRNFCLNVFPVRALVISGGVAMRNPHLLQSDNFMEALNSAENYRALMSRIPVLLNTDEHPGIRGAAIHAASQM